MIKILTNEDLKKLSPEDKAFLAGFCRATDSAANLLYNLDVYKDNFDVDGVDINLVRFLENHEEVREALRRTPPLGIGAQSKGCELHTDVHRRNPAAAERPL